MSDQAATVELKIIKAKDNKAVGATLAPNHSTSPYAMTIIVKFLKIVKTGTERNWRA